MTELGAYGVYGLLVGAWLVLTMVLPIAIKSQELDTGEAIVGLCAWLVSGLIVGLFTYGLLTR